MAQHDYVLDNQGFGAMRADMNLALAAIASGNSGNTAPPTVYPGLTWVDTSGTPWLVKQYNGTQWVTLYGINATTHVSDIVRGGTDSKLLATTALANMSNLQAITYAAATAITAAATTDITNTTDNIDLAGSAVTVTAITAPAALIGRRIRVRVTGSNITVNNGGGITVPNGLSASFNAGDLFTLVITAANTVRIEGVVPASIQSFNGFKNRIINGAMTIDQRNVGAAQTFTAAAALAYCVDRWYGYCTGANVTGQRVAGTSPNQFNYQFTGAASVTKIGFAQRIEAVNSQDLAGQTATLSVDLANSLLTTVTYTLWYANTADTFGTLASPTRTQIATGTFTVNSTLTRYSVPISIPSAATTGIEVELSVGAQTSGTFTIGRVQLERATSASAFDSRPYGLELSLCQRYYETARDINLVYSWTTRADTGERAVGFIPFANDKRAVPTLSFTTGSFSTPTGTLNELVAGYPARTPTSSGSSTRGINFINFSSAVANAVSGCWIASSEL